VLVQVSHRRCRFAVHVEILANAGPSGAPTNVTCCRPRVCIVPSLDLIVVLIGGKFQHAVAGHVDHGEGPVAVAADSNWWYEVDAGYAVMDIRRSDDADVAAILGIINDAAVAYRGVIPADRWHEPYMSAHELQREIESGVIFWLGEQAGRVVAVMGMQDKGDVTLVRHAYVASTTQRSGVGTRLLRHVESLVDKPILIGTWAAASWAIEFYQRNGFSVVSTEEKNRLIRSYWSIPTRQVETSVVLANARWTALQSRATTAAGAVEP
jgi:N-acetylglutamate synthase-like GNAT family acetyltransferase